MRPVPLADEGQNRSWECSRLAGHSVQTSCRSNWQQPCWVDLVRTTCARPWHSQQAPAKGPRHSG
eukprot:1878880-Alexandrium_andersonii.AAC.1